MSWYLRQSTASQEIPLGPFLDSSDGNTAETGLTISNTDIKIQKSGATSEASKNSGGATHISSGRYYCVLDATDTDTIGPMRVSVHVSGALAVWLDCTVLAANVYDVLFGTTAPSTLTQAQVSGGAYALNSASFAFNAALDFTTAQKAATLARVTLVDTCTTNTDMRGTDGANTVTPPTVAELEARTLLAAAYATATNQTTILSKTNLIPASPAAVGDIPTAAAVADAVQSSAAASPLPANIKEVNDIAIDGAGTTADPWGPV